MSGVRAARSAASSPTSSTCSQRRQRVAHAGDLAPVERGVVTSTRASPERSRCADGSGPKAENSGQNTLPCFSVPSAATYSSGPRPSRLKTRSPRPTPRRSQDARRTGWCARRARRRSGRSRGRRRRCSAARRARRGPAAVPVDGLVGDVQPAPVRQAGDRGRRGTPAERRVLRGGGCWRVGPGQVGEEPVAGQAGDPLQGAGLLEQVGGAGDDDEAARAGQPRAGPPVERRAPARRRRRRSAGSGACTCGSRGAGQVGPAAAGDDRGDVGAGLGRPRSSAAAAPVLAPK